MGCTMVPFKGLGAVGDFTTVDPIDRNLHHENQQDPRKAAEVAERKKERKYEFLQERYIFLSIRIGTFGTRSPSVKSFATRGCVLKLRDVKPRSSVRFRQRLNIALHRRNVCCVLGTNPCSEKLHEVLNLLHSDGENVN